MESRDNGFSSSSERASQVCGPPPPPPGRPTMNRHLERREHLKRLSLPVSLPVFRAAPVPGKEPLGVECLETRDTLLYTINQMRKCALRVKKNPKVYIHATTAVRNASLLRPAGGTRSGCR
ncbi:hypothetical protein EYF80_039044 [Liparis tanakae]|uniref:Uncharacterized protein n=1 Tax=Liparis tanakae TaxID=230148 RepID=A0A4Z2GCT0_9TELE|nr:hypothetical protein EYF80_039044 [Liparis tanakae]